jgi:Domain of unknown function (DUF4224)
MTQPAPLTLTPDELVTLTGYRRAHEQLAELQRQGFHRARRSLATGAVILERAHFEAVCRGEHAERPKVRPPRLRGAVA